MPLDTRQQKWLPLGLNPQLCFQDIPTGSTTCPGIPSQELGSIYAAEENQVYYMQPPLKTVLLNTDLQSCGKQVSCLNERSPAPQEALKSFEKRFLIFDQTGNQTRLLQCGFPGQFPSVIEAEQGKTSDSHDPDKSFIPKNEDLVENQYDGKESELHEDTEEINALLYSDDEEDDDDDCESDDEVMSTGHSPFPIEQACNKTELDETDSSDGPRKKQKLMDHAYSDASSLVGTNSFTKLKELSDETLPESNISNKQETGSGLSHEQSKKDKIHTALSILESVVPGSKGKDALLLLDEAIDYLKLLKRNLNPSGVNNHW